MNEEGDSAWLVYESPSQNQELKRMETRILEVGNDVKRLQLDVHSLKLNLDCVAVAVKNMSSQTKMIIDMLRSQVGESSKKTRNETCRAVDINTDSENDEGDALQIKLRSGKVLPERQEPVQKERNREALVNKELPTSSNQAKLTRIEYNVLSHLRKVPALLSVYDALMMSKELREVLIYALQNPEPFHAYFAETSMKEALYLVHTANITFTEKDLLMGTTHHNRPLYVTGTSDGEKMNRILIDPGSSVNLMTLRTLKSLAMDVGYLNSEKVVIQGFNQHSQKALGSITLPIRFGKLQTEAKFYVINADTSYKALLGRPWLHKYHIVPSTLHQCLKYIKDGEEYRIDGDIRPFGVHEIRYEDARYFIELEDTKENRNISREQSSKEKKLVDEIKKESTVPHFGSDSDSSDLDEDELCWAMKLLSNNWNTPEVENSSEDEHHFTAYVRADRMIAKASDLVEDTLTILKVPEEYHRLIPARQVSVVDHLKTFFVPPKIEDVEGRRTVKRGILFYKSDDKKSTDVIRSEDYDDDIYEDIEIPNYFSASLIKMIHKLGCPTRRSWANHKFFQRMWNPPQRRSILPNDKSSNTRGLGYYRSFAYQDIYTCNMINANEDITEHLVDEQKSLEPKDAPQELEDGGQATVDELLEINLGTEEDPRPTYISALLPEEEQEKLKTLLIEFKDCFAWSYKEMSGLNPEVAVHKLAIDSQAHPVKQAPRRMRVDLEEQIITETKKLIEAGFIREEKYANWIASIVPVKKKNGQIRICVDFRDLNKACPKDDFPLPITELMIDNTSSCELFSFMDGSSGYNQIKMSPEDEKHTAFRTPIGIYCYKVMPFGLKNAGATYQRAMTRIFADLLHKTVECYVDDLVVKTKNKKNHFQDLTTVFTRLREY
ncbi:uncharacterized protein LOC109704178 [Ananas comosus]|uniref:Uncharacterized protein LOC109704178 n=1 Tax=Ananas comosus TaxID=4615 RepID=A0A6P5EFX0_ANACO|nr:uncharacterized protein LOC109704178 [Ananas comosus]